MPDPHVTPGPPTDAELRPIKLTILGVAVALMLLALLVASLPIKVLVLVMGLCTLQGLWRGAIELAGLVLGMIIAVILARPLGLVLEGVTASLFGASGLVNRGLAMGVAALLVTAIITILFAFTAGRALKKKRVLARWDKLAGAGIGFVEGSVLGLVVLWVPLALEPVAAAQLAAREADPTMPKNPTAERMVSFAKQVRTSALGSVAEATNPAAGADILSLANEAAAISRNPERFEHLREHDAVRRLQALDSFNQALDMLNTDPELAQLFDEGNVDATVIHEIMRSDTMLRIMDETSLIDDVRPLIGEIREAVREAAAQGDGQ